MISIDGSTITPAVTGNFFYTGHIDAIRNGDEAVIPQFVEQTTKAGLNPLLVPIPRIIEGKTDTVTAFNYLSPFPKVLALLIRETPTYLRNRAYLFMVLEKNQDSIQSLCDEGLGTSRVDPSECPMSPQLLFNTVRFHGAFPALKAIIEDDPTNVKNLQNAPRHLDQSIFQFASWGNSIKAFQSMLQNKGLTNDLNKMTVRYCFEEAAKADSLDILKIMLSTPYTRELIRPQTIKNAFVEAARDKSFNALSFLFDNSDTIAHCNSTVLARLFPRAANQNSPKTLTFLLENPKVKLTSKGIQYAFRAASEVNAISCAQLIINHPLLTRFLNRESIVAAFFAGVRNDHPETLKLILDNPITAQHIDLDLLKNTYVGAIREKNEKAIEFLKQLLPQTV